MIAFVQLAGERPSDRAAVTRQIEFLICSACFLTVAWAWQEALFTYCMYSTAVFHFQTAVLVSDRVLVSVVLGRYDRSEPGW